MDRQTVKAVNARILSLVQDTIKKEFGFEVRSAGRSFSDTEYTMKLNIGAPVSSIAEDKTPIAVDRVHYGVAPRGTAILCGKEEYVVVKARQTKYLVSRVSDGKQFLIRFTGCMPKYPA